MNKIVDKFLLTGDKFKPKVHLKQPLTKHCKRIKKFRETDNLKHLYLKHLYRNQLAKTCLAYDAAYSHSKDFAKRTISDKILKDRAYVIARNWKYDIYQRALAGMVNKFFDKKTGSGVSVK